MVSSTNLTGSGAVDHDVIKSFIHNGKTAPDVELIHTQSKRSLKNRKENKGSSLRQVAAAFIACFGSVNTGMVMGFSAVAIPQLMDENATLRITAEEASWVASLSSIGTPCGCILSAYLTDFLGRKQTLVLTEVPAIIGWIIIAVAPSTGWIYAGRILTGVSSGMIGAPSRVYTAEVSQPHLRGILSSLASVDASLGVTLEYLIGSLCDWKLCAWISSTVPVFSILTCLLLPESPSWLITSGKKQKCFNSLKKLRGSTCDVQREVNTLIEFSERNHSRTANAKEKGLLCHSSVIKPFFILTTYFFIYQMSGSSTLTFYVVTIFEDFGKTENKYSLTVLIGVARLLFTIAGCVLMLRCRRRTLTFISSIGCGIFMLLLGVYGFLLDFWKSNNIEPIFTWIPVISIFMTIIMSTIGYLIVPWVMIGELYPTKVRGLVGGLTTALCHLFMFFAVKTYPHLRTALTKSGPFLLYGSISLIGTIFLLIFLPETKDKTLQEIEERFSQGKCKSSATAKEKKPIVTNNNKVNGSIV